MRRFLMLSSVAMISFWATQMAMADPRPDGPPPACHAQDKKCPERHRDEARRGDQRHDERQRPEPQARRHADLRPGDSGKAGKPFRPGRDSRLQAAPRGQEYRVIRDQLVLMDSHSKKILRILGPAAEAGR